jgi:hypothetical protein
MTTLPVTHLPRSLNKCLKSSNVLFAWNGREKNNIDRTRNKYAKLIREQDERLLSTSASTATATVAGERTLENEDDDDG